MLGANITQTAICLGMMISLDFKFGEVSMLVIHLGH